MTITTKSADDDTDQSDDDNNDKNEDDTNDDHDNDDNYDTDTNVNIDFIDNYNHSNHDHGDVAGFSDPYCMLGIMPGHHDNDSGGVYSSGEEDSPISCSPKSRDRERVDSERRHSGRHRFSLHRKKDRSGSASVAVRDMLPARLIRTTVVRPNTLSPVWKEKFRLSVLSGSLFSSV